MGRATTAARGAGRVAREREDVRRAEDELQDLLGSRRELELEAKEEVRALRAAIDLESVELEEVLVRPRKSDISVSDLRLAWRLD
jgi:Mg2+/Co2+ transporter CorB